MTVPLDPARWRQIDAVLDLALDLAPDARAAYLAKACAGDAALQREVEELLAASAAPDSFLSTPAAARAAALVADAGDPQTSTVDPLPGRIVGAYRLVRKLGEGGMGFVYLAERADGAFEQQVAIKLAKHAVYDDVSRRRFLQERQILARLQHPSIAQLLDGGVTDDGSPFFVMEYVNGQPVTEYCEARGLRPEARLPIFLQICDAVQTAHRNLIVHRDLKPSNILVDEAGRVTLLDFGIAKLLDDGDADPRRAGQTIVRVLTPDYAAPEQLRGEPVSTSTDVYALGVLLYELLSGARPYRFKSGAFGALEQAILEQPITPPSARISAPDRRRAVRGDLDRVVLKALEKIPGRRYPSVEALAADVERHLDGRPVLAHGDALWYRVGKFVRRHLVGAAAAALVVLTLVGGLVATTWQARRAAREARKAEAVKDFLKSLFSAGDPATAQGREPTVRQLLDRGAARIETDLAGQPDVQSEVARVVATVFQSLGEYDRIPVLLTPDLERRRRLDGARTVVVAELLTQIADARYEQNRYDEAAGMYEEALAIQRERRGPRTPQVAELLWDLAGVKRNRGDLAGAETLERESLALYVDTKGADSAEAMAVRESLAITEGQSGKLEEGVELLRPVVEWRTMHLGVDHPDTLNSRYNLAVALQIADRPAEALATIEDVIARQRRVLGPRHDRLAGALRLRARALDALGRSAEGRAAIDEAIAIQTQEFGTEHLQVAIDRVWRAEIQSHTGHLIEANADARAALGLFDSLRGSPPASVPPLRARAALVLAEGGDLTGAAAHLTRAVSELRAMGSVRGFLGEALDGLGEVERRRGHVTRAAELTREALEILERDAGPSHRATRLARAHAAAAIKP